MGPIIYRHDVYWGAPRTGFYYDSPRFDFGFRPRPMYCGNPFGSFMGGFTGGFLGGLIASSACGWGGSYASYPSSSVSVFPNAYSSAPMGNFGYDSSAQAFDDAFARFVDSFSVPRNSTASAPTQNWSSLASMQDWSMPFSSLTTRPHQTYSVLPKRTTPQTSESIAAHRTNSASSDAVQASETNSTPTPPVNTSASVQTEPEIAMDAATFNAKCKGGDCGDYTDRLYYNMEKGEWEKSTTKGYPKQPIAPTSTLAEVPGEYLTNTNGTKYYLNPEALKHFVEMSQVAFSSGGMQLTITSAYRSYKDQQREFENDKERLIKSKEEGNKPLPKAAPPGYSEHHTGYVFDIANMGNIGNRDEWLAKNAKIYGFELSYKPDNKLGVLQEGWHYRFNPELCERYKTQREELLKKYTSDPSEYVKG